MHCLILTAFFLIFSPFSHSNEPDWSENAIISANGRPNPYEWDEKTLSSKIQAGKLHALNYPVSVTGLLVPARPAMKMLDAEPGTPLFTFLKTILSLNSDFKNFKGFWKWLGLHDYPESPDQIPYPGGVKPDYPMGVSLIKKGNATGLTFGCAACHSAELFGRPILGMTNRFPQANLLFLYGQKGFHSLSPRTFGLLTGATRDEKKMYADSRDRITAIAVKKPQALGLDTSLAQVALSLSKRSLTAWAERNHDQEAQPRPNLLDTLVSDSKPAVWWNVKYKNRFLSDGSVVSGNPIFTNFLWNEIGRGADLPELVEWLSQNKTIVEELTTAVFATTAPKYKDFFGEGAISVERAKRGAALFEVSCARCHGQYEKAWDLSTREFQLKQAKNPALTRTDTLKVTYHANTPVKEVGTDPGRREGMQALAEALNPLEFSQNYKIKIIPQAGYVPPPLEGIWARYPYLHNNSIPNLCALMTKPESRPKKYYSGEAIDPNRDYDQDCLGYPTGAKTPSIWANGKDAKEHLYDTSRPGLSNQGHFEGIFTNRDGTEKLTEEQKRDLREYLKTL